MPELPDLEVLKVFLNQKFAGEKIVGVELKGESFLKTKFFPPEVFKNSTLERINRRGKLLIFEADNGFKLVFHPMLRGWVKEDEGEIFTFKFESGKVLGIYEVEPVKLLQLYIVKKPENLRVLKSLGPEPIDSSFTADYLKNAAEGFKGTVKKLITTQKIVAGIGNAYADEILWHARINPFRKVSQLKAEDFENLVSSTKKVLKEAIEAISRASRGNIPPFEFREHMKIHRKEGQPCPRCGTPIEVKFEKERGTWWCPTCQKE